MNSEKSIEILKSLAYDAIQKKDCEVESAIGYAIKAIVEQDKNNEGCGGCEYVLSNGEEYPCNDCRHTHTNHYKKKAL